ncbi:hypothetical protein GCM10009616_32430 [Microlunatus lacustris]
MVISTVSASAAGELEPLLGLVDAEADVDAEAGAEGAGVGAAGSAVLVQAVNASPRAGTASSVARRERRRRLAAGEPTGWGGGVLLTGCSRFRTGEVTRPTVRARPVRAVLRRTAGRQRRYREHLFPRRPTVPTTCPRRPGGRP